MSLPVSGVNELVLEVGDLAASERFYAGALGLPVVERWSRREAIWLMAGARTRIGLWRPQVGVAGGRGGAHVHFALHLRDEDFDDAVARLRAHGLEPQVERRRRRGRTRSRSAYVDDPDGNCVELWTQDVGDYLQEAAPRQLPEEACSPEHFDAEAARWDAEYDQPTVRGHWWRSRQEAVLRLVGDPGGDLLELGLGPGRLAAALTAGGWTVSGVDASPRMVELARSRVPGAAARLSVGRAESLPYPDASFDAAVAIGVLEYADTAAALRELVRVLRPGGRAVLGLRNGRAPASLWHARVVLPAARALKRVVAFGRPLPAPRRRAQSPAQGRRLLEAAGLAVERVEVVACAVLPDPIDALAPRTAYRAARRAERVPALRRRLGTQQVLLARRR